MKSFLSLAVGLGCLCTAVQAQVPSLINYQGRLTDKAGTPVNGAVDVVLRVYDAKTDGKKVYEETISQVSVVNGVYSFGYGGAGKSTKRSAEVVAVADGETKVFNYSTDHKPLLGDVQLSDGTYTWGSSSGPSDAAQFIGSINTELGNVTAIYIQNAPAKDSIINTIYHYHAEGIIGALSQNKECWQELTINGKTLSPRERLVSVPFAQVAGQVSQPFKNIYGFSSKFEWGELYTAKSDMLLFGSTSDKINNNAGAYIDCKIFQNGNLIRSSGFGPTMSQGVTAIFSVRKDEGFRLDYTNLSANIFVIEF
jgi:hypothetical protein